MSGQTLLFAALAAAAIVVAVVLALTLWRLRRTIENMDRRMDEAARQFEMAAEDFRKTNAIVRDILDHARGSAANMEHLTEGIRSFRKSLDAANSVLQFIAIPVLGNVAGGMAGVKAVVSHVVNRFVRKERSHG